MRLLLAVCVTYHRNADAKKRRGKSIALLFNSVNLRFCGNYILAYARVSFCMVAVDNWLSTATINLFLFAQKLLIICYPSGDSLCYITRIRKVRNPQPLTHPFRTDPLLFGNLGNRHSLLQPPYRV